MYHLESNKMPGEKSWWGIHLDALCVFEHFLEIPHFKTVVAWSLTAHRINQPSKIVRHSGYWRSKDEVYGTPILCKNIHQLYADTGCCLEDLPRAIADKKRESKVSVMSSFFDDDDDDDP